MVFRGTVSGTATSPAGSTQPFKVISFWLSNLAGGTNTVRVSAYNSAADYYVVYDLVLAAAGTADSIYQGEIPFFLLNGDQIKVSSTASLGFYFSYENVEII